MSTEISHMRTDYFRVPFLCNALVNEMLILTIMMPPGMWWLLRIILLLYDYGMKLRNARAPFCLTNKKVNVRGGDGILQD
jgi:hypothetical protein